MCTLSGFCIFERKEEEESTKRKWLPPISVAPTSHLTRPLPSCSQRTGAARGWL
eukprot:CAMPEP_0195058912 /NCGR_PEP_ID=MMETSP0448-20130528/6548_1 /TAXON_ID=66468 /ORGANISM="Heterocapsa triquestra, Strain CCMP 448" /LENGTH=53 /DNA_ID=CAMNT_0040089097 /DNA_START=335 /DNA_END=492 /DNA_ORIENTATION=+